MLRDWIRLLLRAARLNQLSQSQNLKRSSTWSHTSARINRSVPPHGTAWVSIFITVAPAIRRPTRYEAVNKLLYPIIMHNSLECGDLSPLSPVRYLSRKEVTSLPHSKELSSSSSLVR